MIDPSGHLVSTIGRKRLEHFESLPIMSSAAYIVADYVCPTIGAILSTLAFSAPIKSLKACIKNGSLGALNPTPWAFMTGKCDVHASSAHVVCAPFV